MGVTDPVVAAALAVGMSILAMHLTRSLHPPGAGTAIAMVLSAPVFQHHGWLWAASVVIANALLSLLAALLVNNLVHPGRYPVCRLATPTSDGRSATPAADGEPAQLKRVGEASGQDVREIGSLASEHAQRRK